MFEGEVAAVWKCKYKAAILAPKLTHCKFKNLN
jgi:hypothetical protein